MGSGWQSKAQQILDGTRVQESGSDALDELHLMASGDGGPNMIMMGARVLHMAMTALTTAARRRRRLMPAATQPKFALRCLAITLGASRKRSSVTAESSKASSADRSIASPRPRSIRAMVRTSTARMAGSEGVPAHLAH
jgi:hypothetical protein